MIVKSTKAGFTIYWTASDTKPIRQTDAIKAQNDAGYAVPGYGLYNFVCSPSKDLFIATWECSTSCD